MAARTRWALLVLLSMLGPVGSTRAGDPTVVTFRTEDRLTITGDLWWTGRRGAAAVIALHMYPTDRTSWRPIAGHLEKAGIDLLAIDMRGYGDSAVQRRKDLSAQVRERKPALFRAMYRDALAAYAFLIERGADPERVAFLGASVGCSVAIDAAAREPRIRGAVVMTPGSSYLGVETMKHLKGYGTRPLLILSARKEAEDGATPIANALGKTAELVLLDQVDIHGTFMFGKVAGIEERIATWLGELLGAGIVLDGKVFREEAAGGAFGEWDAQEEGKGHLTLKPVGRWVYVAVKMDPPQETPADLLVLAWAPGGKGDRAHRLVCRFGKRGSCTLESYASGRWKPVKGAIAKGVQYGASTGKAAEMLIPRSLPGLDEGGRLKVAFGFARRSGIPLPVLPSGDQGMNRFEMWLDFGL